MGEGLEEISALFGLHCLRQRLGLGLAMLALGGLGLTDATSAVIGALAALTFTLTGLQLTFTGALGAYVASASDDARARPLYLISEMVESAPVTSAHPASRCEGSAIPVLLAGKGARECG